MLPRGRNPTSHASPLQAIDRHAPALIVALPFRRASVLLPFVAAVLMMLPSEAAAQGRAGLPGGLLGTRSDIASLQPSEDANHPVFAPFVEGDEDLGTQVLLRQMDRYRPWRVQGAGGFYWTDNAALTEFGELEDVYFNGNLRADFLPHLKDNLYGNFYTSYEFYRYDENELLDFDDLETGLGLVNVFRELGDLSVFGRYNYERIIEATNDTEVYTNHSMVLGLYKPFIIDRQHFAYTRFESDLGFSTAPSILRRFEHSLTLGYRYSPLKKLSLDAYFRLRYFDYQNQPGNDCNHQPGMAVTYDFKEWLRLAASAYVAYNDSSRPGGDYSTANLGGFIALRVKF